VSQTNLTDRVAREEKTFYKVKNKIPTLTCLYQNLWISSNHRATKRYSLFFKWPIKEEDASCISS